jgi:hypothetical protein
MRRAITIAVAVLTCALVAADLLTHATENFDHPD